MKCKADKSELQVGKWYSDFIEIRKHFPMASFRYVTCDDIEREIPESELGCCFAEKNYIVLSIDMCDFSVAVCKSLKGGDWEVGLRKAPGASRTAKIVRRRVKALPGIEGVFRMNGCWYARKKLPDEENIAQKVVMQMAAFLNAVYSY